MSIPVISIAQMREWEKASWAAGKSEGDVIRRVGKILAHEALRLTNPGDAIVILAGKGHNGDDARYAPANTCSIATCKGSRSKIPQRIFRNSTRSLRIPLWSLTVCSASASIARDAAYVKSHRTPQHRQTSRAGRGCPVRPERRFRRTPRRCRFSRTSLSPLARQKLGRSNITRPKIRWVPDLAEDTGLIACPHQSELNWTTPQDFRDFPPRRSLDGHKGTFGHLAIIAGSLGYHGAAVLASRGGAQRAQPGLITLFTQERAYVPIAAQLQAVMVSVGGRPKTELLGKIHDRRHCHPGLGLARCAGRIERNRAQRVAAFAIAKQR